MASLMAARIPLGKRILPTLPTLPTDMGTLGNPTPCATTGGEGRRESEGSEDQVSPLLQEVPVSELAAEGKAPVFRKAKDV
jgi:hypothetical protein